MHLSVQALSRLAPLIKGKLESQIIENYCSYITITRRHPLSLKKTKDERAAFLSERGIEETSAALRDI